MLQLVEDLDYAPRFLYLRNVSRCGVVRTVFSTINRGALLSLLWWHKRGKSISDDEPKNLLYQWGMGYRQVKHACASGPE